MQVLRTIEANIKKNITKQKVGILLGARRVGKTSLLKKIFDEFTEQKLWMNGEDADVQNLLANRTVANYKRILQETKLLIIDEAQQIPEVGRIVKLIIDEIKPIHIIITGSSAFDIAQQGYPLVGRALNYFMYGISQAELNKIENTLEVKRNLEDRLIYGSYPELVSLPLIGEKHQYLQHLVNTYLLKDILEFERIKNAAVLRKLLILLAFQIGKEVSETELAKTLEISKNTVAKYLDLLEKSFVIFSLTAYSKNLRKEVSKTKKWFFYDLGVRNMLINNFSPLAVRQDVGQLWENYCVLERKKKNEYAFRICQSYFWRTYDQQEIDYIETENENIEAFEIKWKAQKVKVPIAFRNSYPDAGFDVIEQENYLGWIS
jgi:uncharacterized protein